MSEPGRASETRLSRILKLLEESIAEVNKINGDLPGGGGGGGAGTSRNQDRGQAARSSRSFGSRKTNKRCDKCGRRRKMVWSALEKEKLKELVPKFTSSSGTISWKSVLKDGKSVFCSARIPDDLRGKWKLMRKKHA
ncbi:hypothetical protein LINGRAHAP2_LOCUS12678 [Linum grandiflorum]